MASRISAASAGAPSRMSHPVPPLLKLDRPLAAFARYDASDVPPAYRHIARYEKPVDAGVIARALGSGTVAA